MNQWIALSFIIAVVMALQATPGTSVPQSPAQAAWKIFQVQSPCALK